MLAAHGVTLEAARRKTGELIGDPPGDSTNRSYTPRATVVFKLTNVEAERLGQVEPVEAHMLLALITEGENVPMHLFGEFGVDVNKLREDVLEALAVPNDLREVTRLPPGARRGSLRVESRSEGAPAQTLASRRKGEPSPRWLFHNLGATHPPTRRPTLARRCDG